ncbi:uncharacterized protein LOC111301977 [Durio zibethinus]|uniref:Uncharacterized protein LOC111301977 n=1 Tax=Durio zibethinus TaxID=66656 RepID=A0A6P5ZM94_DURZI|nr:uncharacterized protein LOC111301977 [Durio zibethinus]
MKMDGIISLLLVCMIILLTAELEVVRVASFLRLRFFLCSLLKKRVGFGVRLLYVEIWMILKPGALMKWVFTTTPSSPYVFIPFGGNIANYLNLMEVDSMYLPVPVNFIFIGFEGKGNQEFKLHPEELEGWFTKIDHILAHTLVPQNGELINPFNKISIDKMQHHHLPSISHIYYNFSVHAIQMGEKVTSVFGRAINVLAHKDDVSDDRDGTDSLWQVDVDMMDVLFTSLVEYLQLEDAYNIFVLNP